VPALASGRARPTSAGTGGGRSLPSNAGKEMIPAITAAPIAAARATLRHRI
jgi:hypothetical protein